MLEHIYAYLTIAVLLGYFVFLRKKAHSSVKIEVDGEVVRRNVQHQELTTTEAGVNTAYDSWKQAVERLPEHKCLGTRALTKGTRGSKDAEYGDYEWKSYKEVDELAVNFASGLVKIGASRGDRIGVFSKNREEWIVTQLASYAQSFCIVSFYETLGKETIRYVAQHSEIKVAVCSADVLDTMIQVCEGNEGYKGLKQLILMDEVSDAQAQKVEQAGVKLYYFADILAQGKKSPVKVQPPTPKDYATIMYTSGTTGNPKGVPLSHGNLAAQLAGIRHVADIDENEVYLSYLPFAHIFERVIVAAVFQFNGRVGFFHGDTLGLVDDLKVLKPTVFCGVPRVFDRTMQSIQKKVAAKPLPVQLLFKTVFSLKAFFVEHAAMNLPLPIIDNLVFGEIRKALGGNTWLLLSAGAPLSLQAEIFLRVCFGCSVTQAYGLTEIAGACSLKFPEDPTVGHLGAPLPCCEFKLEDIPDMGYTGNRGELCVRGPTVSSGYYKDEEKTKETWIDGWFHTGDVAEFTVNGSLKIIDRKKNIFKLAQGEYVAAEKIEERLAHNNEIIHQIFIYGDSHQNTLVAIVVPNKRVMTKAMKESGDYSKMCASKEARDYILSNLKEKGKKEGLHGFEIPANVVLFDEEEGFTTDNDMLTPTLKFKRQTIQKNFQKQIDAMYKNQDPSKVQAYNSKGKEKAGK